MTALHKVERAAAKAAHSRAELENAMREAHESGAPLRAIAQAANVSHEHVRSLIRQDQA